LKNAFRIEPAFASDTQLYAIFLEFSRIPGDDFTEDWPKKRGNLHALPYSTRSLPLLDRKAS
jgi:hypothetical protein